MNYTIEAVAADGTRAQATLTANGTRFPAEPGTQYRIREIDGNRGADDVRIVRDGNDLTINGLPDTGEVPAFAKEFDLCEFGHGSNSSEGPCQHKSAAGLICGGNRVQVLLCRTRPLPKGW